MKPPFSHSVVVFVALLLAFAPATTSAQAIVQYEQKYEASLPLHMRNLTEMVTAYWSLKDADFDHIYQWWKKQPHTEAGKPFSEGFDATLGYQFAGKFLSYGTSFSLTHENKSPTYGPSIGEQKLFKAVEREAKRHMGLENPIAMECEVSLVYEGSQFYPVDCLSITAHYPNGSSCIFHISLSPSKEDAEKLPNLEILVFRTTYDGAPLDPQDPYVGLLDFQGGSKTFTGDEQK